MSSETEVRDIVISVLVLSFAFYNALKIDFLTALIVITLGFLLHELSHRYLARKYGCFAEFKMWTWGVVLAILSSFTGFIFAAPGAVYISPYKESKGRKFAFSVAHLTKREYGKISLAGPATNIAVACVSLAMWIFYKIELFSIVSSISFYLSFFNLLPIPPLDGSKVFAWDRRVWLAAFAVSIAGLISSGLV
jgi:Zn-dependent protease